MTTAVLTSRVQAAGSRHSLEELVDRVIEAIFGSDDPVSEPAAETTPTRSLARSVHDARRLRQSGDLDGALALFAGVDTKKATARESRWAHAEWLDVARRRFRDGNPLVYSPGAGRAAALARREDGALEVVAVLGMRWQPGRTVSRRSLRGLRPLLRGGP